MTTESELIKRYTEFKRQNPNTPITFEDFRKFQRQLIEEEKEITEEIYK